MSARLMACVLFGVALLSIDAGAKQAIRGAPRDHAFAVDGSAIVVHFESGGLAMERTRILRWIKDSAAHLADYYGRFPVDRLRINIEPVHGSGVQTASTYGYGQAHINVSFGRASHMNDLADDWVLTHELVHLAFPRVPQRHHWIEEGIATYVEPLVRNAAAELSSREVWRELVSGLPKGLPRPGDRGLDRTHTWGRTYWGGALYCLLADVEIRRRTGNRYGLGDALRAIVGAGGRITEHWPLKRALTIGDRAVGVPVLTELYAQMRATPVHTDLPALWDRLGIESRAGRLRFENRAPLAKIRRAITPAPIDSLSRSQSDTGDDAG